MKWLPYIIVAGLLVPLLAVYVRHRGGKFFAKRDATRESTRASDVEPNWCPVTYLRCIRGCESDTCQRKNEPPPLGGIGHFHGGGR